MEIIVGIGIVLLGAIFGGICYSRLKNRRKREIEEITERASATTSSEGSSSEPSGSSSDETSSPDYDSSPSSEPDTCSHGFDRMHCSICGPSDRLC